jgi:GTP cyclohydrolase I
MRDVQNERDVRNIPIDRVGVKDLSYPVSVLDRAEKVQHTVATLKMSVSLPKEFRGTHMSRFIEVLDEFKEKLTITSMEHMTERLRESLDADTAEITASFPYFISRCAPSTGISSLSRYEVTFDAIRGSDFFDLRTTVTVPVQTLCPCSKEISERGAHNQRGYVRIATRMRGIVWIEELVDIAEASGSAPVYTLLKREDEKHVTEMAYDNPRFVEDVIREAVVRLEEEQRIRWYRVDVVSHESIHNHDAFATVERDKK